MTESATKALTILIFGIVYFAIVSMISVDGYTVPQYNTTITNSTDYTSLMSFGFNFEALTFPGMDNWFTNTISAIVGVMMVWAGLNLVLNILEIGKNWI